MNITKQTLRYNKDLPYWHSIYLQPSLSLAYLNQELTSYSRENCSRQFGYSDEIHPATSNLMQGYHISWLKSGTLCHSPNPAPPSLERKFWILEGYIAVFLAKLVVLPGTYRSYLCVDTNYYAYEMSTHNSCIHNLF